MSEPITCVDFSAIRPGRIEELEKRVRELVAFVDANEAAPFAYNVYIDEEGARMTVLQVHPSLESFELHMEIAGPEFRKFQDLVHLQQIDIYGEPGARLTALLREKAELLGGAKLTIQTPAAGFYRFSMMNSVSDPAATR